MSGDPLRGFAHGIPVLRAADPRVGLPRGDVTLAGGTVLHYRGRWLPPSGSGVLDGGAWDSQGRLRVIASLDHPSDRSWGPLLHVSASYPDHDPSWRELRAIKDAYFGDVDAMMILPRAEDYVNRHPHTFHLWQTPERWGIR